MDRKLVFICVLAAIIAVLVISGCTSGPAGQVNKTGNRTNVTAPPMPSASPMTYGGEGGFAQNASAYANVTNATGMIGSNNTTVFGVIGSNNTSAKK